MCPAFTVMPLDEGASSLLITHRNHSYLFDSWLSDDYSIFSKKFYHGKRVHPLLTDLNQLKYIDGIFITSVQDDHCDVKTLEKIPKHLPIWTHGPAVKKAENLGFQSVHNIPLISLYQANSQMKIMRLKGYGGSCGFVLQDILSKETILLAPHSLSSAWLKTNLALIYHLLGFGENPQFDLLGLGWIPTFLRIKGLPRWIFPDLGTNIPLPEETGFILSLLRPKRFMFLHGTSEIRSGWAAAHMVHFPIESKEAQRQISWWLS